MNKRDKRQEAIRRVIRDGSIKTQRDLVDSLNEAGFPCTQATVSRDIADLGLAKSEDGSYILEEDLKLRQMTSGMVLSVERADNLVVVRTTTGTAMGVAAALDSASLPGVMGTIAGDDTILIICRDALSAEEFEITIGKMVG